jgi:hypothetical protein
MSSEPKAVGYVDTKEIAELQADRLSSVQIGTYSERYGRTTPLYDEKALSALRAEVEALRKDAERFRDLLNLLHWDGHGYWLPDICLKDTWDDISREAMATPTLEELRAAIDLAREKIA